MAAPAPRRFWLLLNDPATPEDARTFQAVQAYQASLAPYVQVYGVKAADLGRVPPVVMATGGLPALFDSVAQVRSRAGGTAEAVAALGQKLAAATAAMAGRGGGGGGAGAAAGAGAGRVGPGAPPSAATAFVSPDAADWDKAIRRDAPSLDSGAFMTGSGSGFAGFKAHGRAHGNPMAGLWACEAGGMDSACVRATRDPFDRTFFEAASASTDRPAPEHIGGRGPAAPVRDVPGVPKTSTADIEEIKAQRAAMEAALQMRRGGGTGPPGHAIPEVSEAQRREARSGLAMTRPLHAVAMAPGETF